MKWFKHDSNANRDAKLQRVRMKYGMEGYGLYWYCLELIAGEVDQENITFELEHDAEIIAVDTGIHLGRVQEIMQYMIQQGLFEYNGEHITCMKMLKRIDQSMTSNPLMRKIIDSAKTGKVSNFPTKMRENHDQIMMNPDLVMQDKIRLDKNKNTMDKSENDLTKDFNSNEKNKNKFVKPNLTEVKKYCDERNNKINPEAFIDFYSSKDWMIGKNRMKDWKAAIRTWERSNKTDVREDAVNWL